MACFSVSALHHTNLCLKGGLSAMYEFNSFLEVNNHYHLIEIIASHNWFQIPPPRGVALSIEFLFVGIFTSQCLLGFTQKYVK